MCSGNKVWSKTIHSTNGLNYAIHATGLDLYYRRKPLAICAPPLSLHYPPFVKLLLLALFVNCLMVRVEELFSPFVHLQY